MNPFFIDTHCHINEPEFSEDLDQVVARARESGVGLMLLPSVNTESPASIIDVCNRWPDCTRPMIGLHPEDLSQDFHAQLDVLKSMLDQDRAGRRSFVAVGEIGIDLHWDRSRLDDQIEAFRTQLEWALEYDLPVSVHCRDAHDVMVSVMEPYLNTGLKGVFHCFSGNAQQAMQLLEHGGFMLGIGGVLTYRKSPLPEALADVPRNRVVLETDCPYLPPVPHRGQRNEPSYLALTAQFLADVWGIGQEELSEITTANARHLFNL